MISARLLHLFLALILCALYCKIACGEVESAHMERMKSLQAEVKAVNDSNDLTNDEKAKKTAAIRDKVTLFIPSPFSDEYK